MKNTSGTIIVTGAANGIGKAISIKLHHGGATVLACDKDADGLIKLAQEYPAIKTFPVDITHHAAVQSFFSNKELETAIGLVNNAGVYPGKMGAIFFTQFFARPLLKKKQKGAIVNISSVSGQQGSSDAIYGMTKAALLGLTKSTAINFAPYIRVNAVAPGLVNTQILNHIPVARYRQLRKNELLPEPIMPEDVAEIVCFLLSDAARNITGATFDINNGQYNR
jgi:3-oxoacyl-[acyl-carrier protein] reductase